MTEDQESKDSQSESSNKSFANKIKDRKMKIQRPFTKIVLRRLPPTMTEESFMEQVSPIPEHDYFYFTRPDPSLGNNLFSRAYINFVNVEDIFLFKDKFDGYVFLDDKGVEYVGLVEYAPFQRIPKKKKKKDPKCGTIESDPIYQEFMENLNKEPETENQPKLEYAYPVNDGNDKKVQSTPLLEYLAARKQDKRGRDERRRRENDKRKMRIERKTKDMPIKEEDNGEIEIKKIKSREWEKEKIETKDDHIKSNNQDGSVFESKTYREQRKTGLNMIGDKKKRLDNDKKENSINDDQFDDSEGFKRDKRDKFKESPRELKSKKYSDTRKDRLKQNEFVKSERPSAVSKIISESKGKTLNDDIKPFTQLPQVKTDDLTKLIEGMDRKMKMEEKETKNQQGVKDHAEDKVENDIGSAKIRRSSLESNDANVKDAPILKRQKSLEDRSKSTDREGSEEKEKSEGADQRPERRIRNKDRPSLVIYQPGMGKFSKQRLAKEKEAHTPATFKGVGDNEKKDT